MSGDYRLSHLEKGADYDEAIDDGAFNSFMTEREAVLLPRLLSQLFPSTRPKYFDFACGTGRITSLLEPHTRESWGVDVSASMVAQAAKKCARTRFVIRDITTQPLDESGFDLATAFRFFGNAQDELRRTVFRAVAAHLADGGYFVFNNHRNSRSIRALLQRATGRYEDHADLDLAKLKALMAPAGLRVERTVGIGWWQVASRLDTPAAFASPLARLLEPLSTLPGIGPLCPAYIVVARKVGPVANAA
jgi:predicted TPR repeat methyltransferase